MIYDVIVIGGGPAGMMAAGRAARRGRSVLLLEKNETLGRKLLITGGGRCNLTNSQINKDTIPVKYKDNGKFLFSAFSQFGVEKTIIFFNSQGLKTKEEDEGRIFPASNSAKSVLDTMTKYMKDDGVTVETNVEATGLLVDPDTKNIIVTIKNDDHFIGKSCILASGGNSYPITGSTGEGLIWLKKLGHKINASNPILAPITLKDSWPKKLTGISFDSIKISIFQNDKKQISVDGKILFTHFGVSGSTIFNISKEVNELLKKGKVLIKVDLFPKIDLIKLQIQLQTLLTKNSNKKIINTLSNFVPAKMATAILEITGVNEEAKNHNISSETRKKICETLKTLPLNVSGLLVENAHASTGGVDLKEINFKTMQSRVIPNLYLVGDILDINRPSGGYSLQLCWTTGFVAGDNA
jgi:predicted Rossmann fold flavoprotein